MITVKKPTNKYASWIALEAHYRKIGSLHLRKLFADDPRRGEHMTIEASGIYFDYSKHRITDETFKLLMQLAEESSLRSRIDAMFRGDKINITEKRAVLHVALRTPKGKRIVVEGEGIIPRVHDVLGKMTDFSNQLRNGEWKGYTVKLSVTLSISASEGPTWDR